MVVKLTLVKYCSSVSTVLSGGLRSSGLSGGVGAEDVPAVAADVDVDRAVAGAVMVDSSSFFRFLAFRGG